MIWTILIGVAVGGMLGFAAGRAGKCGGGACPLGSHPLISTISGAILGGIVAAAFVTSGCRSDVKARPQATNVRLIDTAEQFDSDVLASGAPIVVDFFATWCPPCKLLAPTIESLADEYSGRAHFAKVDVDASADLAERYKIEALPTVVLFAGAKEVHRWVGLRKPEEYRRVIDSHMPGGQGIAE